MGFYAINMTTHKSHTTRQASMSFSTNQRPRRYLSMPRLELGPSRNQGRRPTNYAARHGQYSFEQWRIRASTKHFSIGCFRVTRNESVLVGGLIIFDHGSLNLPTRFRCATRVCVCVCLMVAATQELVSCNHARHDDPARLQFLERTSYASERCTHLKIICNDYGHPTWIAFEATRTR